MEKNIKPRHPEKVRNPITGNEEILETTTLKLVDVSPSQEEFDKLKNSGYTLCAWGAKSTSDVIKMNNLGISGMTVNWPTKASKVIE